MKYLSEYVIFHKLNESEIKFPSSISTIIKHFLHSRSEILIMLTKSKYSRLKRKFNGNFILLLFLLQTIFKDSIDLTTNYKKYSMGPIMFAGVHALPLPFVENERIEQVENYREIDRDRILLDKRGGKGMDRHLFSSAVAATLAMGTAALGLTTYSLRLHDHNKNKNKSNGKEENKKRSNPPKPIDTKNANQTQQPQPTKPASPKSPKTPKLHHSTVVVNNYFPPTSLVQPPQQNQPSQPESKKSQSKQSPSLPPPPPPPPMNGPTPNEKKQKRSIDSENEGEEAAEYRMMKRARVKIAKKTVVKALEGAIKKVLERQNSLRSTANSGNKVFKNVIRSGEESLTRRAKTNINKKLSRNSLSHLSGAPSISQSSSSNTRITTNQKPFSSHTSHYGSNKTPSNKHSQQHHSNNPASTPSVRSAQASSQTHAEEPTISTTSTHQQQQKVSTSTTTSSQKLHRIKDVDKIDPIFGKPYSPETHFLGHDLSKHDKWAKTAARIEDYGKLSAATGAFAAGAISLHTAVSQHNHEVKKEGKKEN